MTVSSAFVSESSSEQMDEIAGCRNPPFEKWLYSENRCFEINDTKQSVQFSLLFEDLRLRLE